MYSQLLSSLVACSLNMEDDHNTTNCTENLSNISLTENQIAQLALIRIASGSVSLFTCCLAILLVVIRQAFRTTLQRLLLYITASFTAHLVVGIFGVDDHSHSYYSVNENSCAVIGFLSQYTMHVVSSFSFGAVLYLHYHIRQSSSHHHRQTQTTRYKTRLEIFFVLFSILFPLTYDWIPFIHNAYGAGPREPTCWIRIMNYRCSRIDKSFWYFVVLAYAPILIVVIFGAIFMFIITVTCFSWVCRYRHIRGTFIHEPYTALLLIVYFILFFLYFTVQMCIAAALATSTIPYWMHLMYVIGIPAFMLVLAVLFIVQLYFYRRESRKSSWKNCCREPTEEEKKIIQRQSEQQHQTSPISANPHYVPSHTCTYFQSTSTFNTTEDMDAAAAKDNNKEYGNIN